MLLGTGTKGFTSVRPEIPRAGQLSLLSSALHPMHTHTCQQGYDKNCSSFSFLCSQSSITRFRSLKNLGLWSGSKRWHSS